ncbi:unnamed protein product [Sphagnum balticum]
MATYFVSIKALLNENGSIRSAVIFTDHVIVSIVLLYNRRIGSSFSRYVFKVMTGLDTIPVCARCKGALILTVIVESILA